MLKAKQGTEDGTRSAPWSNRRRRSWGYQDGVNIQPVIYREEHRITALNLLTDHHTWQPESKIGPIFILTWGLVFDPNFGVFSSQQSLSRTQQTLSSQQSLSYLVILSEHKIRRLVRLRNTIYFKCQALDNLILLKSSLDTSLKSPVVSFWMLSWVSTIQTIWIFE